MSRTYKDRNKGLKRRTIPNAMIKKVLHLYAEDIYCKNKRVKRKISKLVRTRLKEKSKKELKKVDD